MASDPKSSLLTPEQYLERERRAEGKSEYWQGQTFAMAGAGRFHNRISRNVIAALTIGLRHTSCQTYGSDMRLNVPATGLYTYPDVMVSCGEERYLDAVLDTLLNPALIIEVLSESTRNYDLGGKFESYRSIPSLREYLTISESQFWVTQHWVDQNGLWTLQDHRDPLAVIALRSLSPLELRMTEIYDKVEWPSD